MRYVWITLLALLVVACGDDVQKKNFSGSQNAASEESEENTEGSETESEPDERETIEEEPVDPDPDPGPEPGPDCTDACTPGVSQCAAPREVCVRGPDGCGQWQSAPCSASEICVSGICETPDPEPTCVDNDGDGFGQGCAPGPDCDDGDNSIFPGATEYCDGVDNDCDVDVDEGACSSCTVDVNEPNDSMSSATLLPLEGRHYGWTCSGDQEFYRIPAVSQDVDVILTATSPEHSGVLSLTVYRGGQQTFSTSVNNTIEANGMYLTLQSGMDHFVEVKNATGQEVLYSVNVIRRADYCDVEDSFAPNQSAANAPLLYQYWEVPAYLCPGADDFYALEQVAAGETIEVALDAEASFLSLEDIDLYLYRVESNGQLTEVAVRATNANQEVITYTAQQSGKYVAKVKLFSGEDGISYSIVRNR